MIARRGSTVSVVVRRDVAREVVERRFDRAAGLQLGDVPDHQVGLERVGMVVVERGAILEPQVEAIAVVAIVVEDGDAVGAERLDDAADDGGLARAGSAGDADHETAVLAEVLVRGWRLFCSSPRPCQARWHCTMTLEGQVMSLRFIGSLRLTQRVAIATALAASLGLTTQAAADERVTALLRGGERVTGRFDGFANGQVHIDVSDTDERKIPVGDVALHRSRRRRAGPARDRAAPGARRRSRAAAEERRRDQGPSRVDRRLGAGQEQPAADHGRLPHDRRARSAASASPRSAASTWAATPARRPPSRRRRPTDGDHRRADRRR